LPAGLQTTVGCGVIALALGLLVTGRTDLSAQQGQTASIDGRVTDDSGAVVGGAHVTAASPQMIGAVPMTDTAADGHYRLSSLLPGTYEIVVTRQGFKTHVYSDIDLPPGLGLTLDVRLELAPVSETVNVRMAAPVIDVHSSSVPTVIDRNFVDNLPLDRFVPNFVNLAPGVVGSVALGGSVSANPFSLDGTDGNEPGWGSPAAVPNTNWLDAVQVVSLGSNAEYGEFTGARTNGVTRSGANRFSGLAEYWTTRSNWTANNRGSLPPDLAKSFRPIEVLEQWATTNQLGGPVSRDRLWFFGGMEYFTYSRRPTAFASVPRTPNEPAVSTEEPKLLVKFTAALTRSSRLEGYVSRDGSTVTNFNAGPLVQPEALASVTQPQWMGNARLTWPLSARTLVEGRYGVFWQHRIAGPTPPSSASGPSSHADSFTGVLSVNAPQISDSEERTGSVAAALTRYVDRVGGTSHALKVGIEHEWAKATYRSAWPGDSQYYDYNGAPDVRYLWAGSTLRPSHQRTSLYVQDAWRVSDRVTLEPGVRIGFYDSSIPVDGIDTYRNSSISPRLGVAWDVAADHSTVIRAHYGRYHDPMVTSFYDFLDPLGQAPTIVMQADGSGQFQEVTRFVDAARSSIDQNAGHSFVDEYVVGGERELPAQVSVRAQYVRRDFREALGFIDIGSTWTPVAATDPGRDGRLGTADDGGPMTVYYNYNPEQANLVLTNPDGAFRNYNGVQAIANARDLHGVNVQASYTWSRTRGSFNNDFSSNAANAELGTNGNFVNPNRALSSGGRTNRDVVHDVKVLATYTLPYWGGLRLSTVYRYANGRPWARTVNFGPLTQLTVVRVEPIGSEQLPATNGADVRVEKTFRAKDKTTIGLFLNVFNVTNQGIPLNVNTQSGPNFGVPNVWLDPLRIRAGVRVMF